MSTGFRLAALAALCGALAPAWSQSASASLPKARPIVIDADTGRARMPTHEEVLQARERVRAPANARSAAPAAAAPAPTVMQHLQARPLPAAMGAVAMRVPASRLSYTVARRGADGKVETVCVTGPEAALQARAGLAAKEDSHAH